MKSSKYCFQQNEIINVLDIILNTPRNASLEYTKLSINSSDTCSVAHPEFRLLLISLFEANDLFLMVIAQAAFEGNCKIVLFCSAFRLH